MAGASSPPSASSTTWPAGSRRHRSLPDGLHQHRFDRRFRPRRHQASGGRIDALFNNGAYGQPGAVEDLKTDVLREQFETNFFGWHELTRQIIPMMRKRGQGRIVQCSSILGVVPYRFRGAYTASKFALEGLSITMRMELEGSGIHVSLIEPGPIESRFVATSLAKINEHIDLRGSAHATEYRRQLARLDGSGGPNRHKLGPDAVYDVLKHALNAGARDHITQ
jgi:NAD(P)-dependent dehydrogenase (short-subunit alcohol dehydrogenase family)